MTIPEHRKPVGEFNKKITNLLAVFSLYGLDVYIPHTEIEITEAALKLHKELNDIDKE